MTEAMRADQHLTPGWCVGVCRSNIKRERIFPQHCWSEQDLYPARGLCADIRLWVDGSVIFCSVVFEWSNTTAWTLIEPFSLLPAGFQPEVIVRAKLLWNSALLSPALCMLPKVWHAISFHLKHMTVFGFGHSQRPSLGGLEPNL